MKPAHNFIIAVGIVKWVLATSVPAITGAPPRQDAATTSAATRPIEDYVQLGLQQNPRIREAHYRIEAFEYRFPQVLSLPDPMVNTNTFLAPVETAAGAQAFGIGVSQKFTNRERRQTAAAIVNQDVCAARAELGALRLEIAEQIRHACYQWLLIRKTVEITTEDAQRLTQIGAVIERQYEVKKSVSQQDVLNVQVEQSRIENQLSELRQKEKSTQARLARLLHLDPRTVIAIGDTLDATDGKLDVDVLIQQAIAARPDLQSQLALIRRDRHRIHLAQLERTPDVTVGLNWIATSADGISPVANGDDALVLGIGFNLPIYQRRIRAGILEAQANQRASETKYESLQDIAAEQIYDLVAQIENTQHTLQLIQQDILPKSERTLEVSIDAYSTDSVDFIQLIENYRSVLRYRIAEANLQSQYWQLLASLARSVGQLDPMAAVRSSDNAGNAGVELPRSLDKTTNTGSDDAPQPSTAETGSSLPTPN